MFPTAPVTITISPAGVLIVNQSWGSNTFTDATHRFRRDPLTGRFVTIGRDIVVTDRACGIIVRDSRNYLTGQAIIGTSGGQNIATTRREAIPRDKAFLEDVDPEDYVQSAELIAQDNRQC